MHDTRLLDNLLKAEKEALNSFKTWSRDAASASAALSAWSVADSGDIQDLMDISIRISQLLSACSDSQRSYTHALSAYRTSLQQVLDRETALKTVVRDREILVNRMIKLNNKKPAESALEAHQAKIEDAQRELTACEAFLQEEEAALNGAKRSSFRDGLGLRMKAMGELGKVMEESANEAIQLLSQIGPDGQELGLPQPSFNDHGSNAGDSITPSHSASQALSRSSSSSSLNRPLSPPLSPKRNGSATGKSITPKATRDALALSLPSANALATRESTPTTPRPYNARRESSQSNATVTSRHTATGNGGARRTSFTGPRPSARLGAIPRAPGTAILPSSPLATHMELPTAPRRIADSESDSDEPAMEEHQPQARGSRLHKGGSGNPRRAMSDGGYDDGKSPQKRKSGFFGALGSIFKRKDKSEDTRRASQWDSRIGNNNRGGRAEVLDTSDDDMPQRVVRVVNDPQARIRAMSDLGRAPPPAKPRREGRRAASEIGAPSGAASIRTTRTSRTVTKQSYDAPVLYSRPSSVLIPPPMRAADARQPASLGLALPSPPPLNEPAKIRKKKKVQQLPDEPMPASPRLNGAASPPPGQRPTIVMSAEELFGAGGVPAERMTGLAVPPTLNRSNSAATAATNATGASGKKKKKKSVATPTVASAPAEPVRPLPTADDLANSLPSSKSAAGPLVLGGLEPYPQAPAGSAPSTPVLGQGEAKVSRRVSTHAPKVATGMEKREENFEATHGTGSWVHPTKGAGKPRHVIKGNHQTIEEGEQERSLMSIVEQPHLEPIRTNGPAVVEPSPANSSPVEATSRSYGGDAAKPRWLAPTPTGSSSASGSGGLAKRKSVRLAENLEVPASMSPPSSVKSASNTSRPGILVHRDPSPTPNMAGVGAGAGGQPKVDVKGKGKAREVDEGDREAGWDTRLAQRGGGTVESDEDSDSDMEEYRRARKQFAKGEKSLKSWSSGLVAK